MSTVKSSEAYLFHTDIGAVKTTVKEINGYDIEDLIGERAYSQAMTLVFQQYSENTDINSPTEARTIKTTYLEEANG